MKISICHYSYHRTFAAERWSCKRLVEEIEKFGVQGIDFHAGLLARAGIGPDKAANEIITALKGSSLELSGLSMSNNYNQATKKEIDQQVNAVIEWLWVAAEIKAPACRIFGGHVSNRDDKHEMKKGFKNIYYGIEKTLKEAEKLGIILALENHGGLPCTGEEQVEVIKKFNSGNLRATIDVGNYMQGGQTGDAGSRIAAPYACYVHFKDFKKSDTGTLTGCTLGEGLVNHETCLRSLKDAGYAGFIAIEYEGSEEERIGLKKSADYTRKVIDKALS